MNKPRLHRYLQQFDFESLFIEELGWDHFEADLNLVVDGTPLTLQAIAEKRGMVMFQHQAAGEIPPAPVRNKIELLVSQRYREHFIIFTDGARTEQKWLWVRRELGRPLARRTHTYTPQQQTGDSLVQKLEALAFSFAEEEDLTLIDVTSRVRAAFNVERATRKFYDQFKKERNAFEDFVQGIPDVDMGKWYVSVMLNRLMFVYFIQRKGFLDGDTDYLRNRMQMMHEQYGGDQFYSFYRYFLLRLFHEGLGEPHHDPELERLVGKVPYLNGGIFQLHEVEQTYPDIQISDEAFTRIFNFFDQYQWHLDDRALRDDKEINPDVLGYIFEKYINQKQMGAYYTKEDITEYISKNTILPFLFDAARKDCAIAFEGDNSVWQLPQADPDRYIYAAVQVGVEHSLPDEIARGLDDVSQRGKWNTRTPDEYALPTEIWRETVARRQRYAQVRGKLAAGDVQSINDFITYNLDIQQLAQDVIENSEGPELLRAFWKALNRVSVLDPTCGSGAFLFAALNILQPLYEACLGRMEAFVEELAADAHPQKYRDFKQVLAQVAQHPNQTYYVLKSIVVNNLYGVDIMAEAVEIAKLRLFLKLTAQVQTVEQIEPLPDIDFNIRAGNTLVGFTSKKEVAEAMKTTQTGQGRLMFGEDQTALTAIEEKAGDVDRLFSRFREMQTSGDLHDFDAADFVETKKQLQARLRELEAELNRYLAQQYGVNSDNQTALEKWRTSYEPFHWFIEFYGILKRGGFNVIVGNPPYVVYRNVKNDYSLLDYQTEACGNLYAFITERSANLLSDFGQLGFIIPVASVCTDGFASLRELLKASGNLVVSSYNDRPGKLFDGLEHIRLSIILFQKSQIYPKHIYTTKYNKWQTTARSYLFHQLVFTETTEFVTENSIPKLANEIEKGILNKVLAQKKSLAIYARKNSSHSICYTRKLSNFVQILDFVPAIYDETGKKRDPSELKKVNFDSPTTRDAFLAILNSSLFHWFLTIYSDCRNLNKREIFAIPFNVDNASPQTLTALSSRVKLLMNDFDRNSQMLEMNYRSMGKLTIQCIYPKFSKQLIDEIDVVLAQHYKFTDEELDFIINYDIKYRMGDDLFADEE